MKVTDINTYTVMVMIPRPTAKSSCNFSGKIKIFKHYVPIIGKALTHCATGIILPYVKLLNCGENKKNFLQNCSVKFYSFFRMSVQDVI